MGGEMMVSGLFARWTWREEGIIEGKGLLKLVQDFYQFA